MGATKIINVVNDDTLEEILGIVQSSNAEEVIFILPKNSKLFSREEHYAKFRAENSDKSFSLLCSSPKINDLARQQGFTILASKASAKRSVAGKPGAKSPVQLAVRTLPQDNTIYDDSTDAHTDDVVVPMDEKIAPAVDTENDAGVGMHIIDDEGSEVDEVDEQDESSDVTDNSDAIADFAIAQRQEVADTRLAVAGKTRRTMDGIIRTAEEPEKEVIISKRKEYAVPIRINRKEQAAADANDIASVWEQHREKTGSLWNGIRTRRHGFDVFRGIRDRSRRFLTYRRFKYAWTLAIAAVIVVGVGLVMYFYPRSARIVITPISKPVSSSFQVELTEAVSESDIVLNKLPAKVLDINASAQKEFNASGQKEVVQKARGKITVYNSYGTAPQPLIATTRFQSPEGLIFRTLQTITVPGAKVTDGQVTPGTVSVEVIADKAGPAYNILPTTFTVIAFKEKGDLLRYEKITGKSDSPFTQGVNGLAKVVTESDYLSAVQSTIQELKKMLEDELTKSAEGREFIRVADPVIGDPQSSVQPDQAAETFTLKVTGKLKVFAYKESDLFELSRAFTDKALNLVAVSGKLNIELDNPKLNEAKNTLTATAHLTGMAYVAVDNDRIVADLLGKPSSQVKTYLETVPTINKAIVNISPSWSSTMPVSSQKITTIIEY